jgi:glutathione-regulated potassium-efflux system ancillary protein KefC
MHGQEFFFQALIFLAAAVISVPLAKRLGLGSVLGYLLAGVLIGPYFFKLVGEEGTDIMHFAEFGVVMMLFLIGLEVKPSILWSMRRSIFGMGGLQMAITTVIVGGIALFFGMNLAQSITIGLIFSMSSTAIVLQTLAEKGLMKTQAGQGSFSVLLFQDIAIIPILAILPLMANQVVTGDAANRSASAIDQAASVHTVPAVEHPVANHAAAAAENTAAVSEHGAFEMLSVASLPGWQQLLIIIGLVAVIIFSGRFLARHVFRFIARTGLREIFTATALLLVIGIAMAMDAVGLSPALGTFLAGVVLADNEYRHELESDIEPFKGLLLGLFFIAVGASIDFNILLDRPGSVMGFLGLLVTVKFLVLLALGRFFRMRNGQELLFSFALAQTGEFAFVLISFSSQNSILPEEVSGIMLIVVALSMLITPLLLIINERLVQPMLVRVESEKQPDEIKDEDNPVIIAGFGRYGIVIGRFLRANGIGATILDNNPDNIRFLRKFGFKVYYGDANRLDLIEAAGAERAKVMIVSVDNRDQITHIVEQVQKNYPGLRIYARAFDVRHSFELQDLGIAGVRRETYDSSIDMGMKVLTELGYNNYQASRASRSFRYHDGVMMNEMRKLWQGDKRKYINEARRFSQQLENILLTEKDHAIHESDEAWDVDTLREEVREIYEELAREGGSDTNPTSGKD